MNSMSLVIPCYNEAATLPKLIARCEEAFAEEDHVEVILVDNGSSDETPQILHDRLQGQALIRSIRVENNEGYGHGILQGLRAAEGDVIGWTHADLQADPADALVALQQFRASADPKSLFMKGARYGRPSSDVVFTVGMSVFESLLLGERLWDINAQPTLFSREFFETWDNPPKDFSLDLYAYAQARKAGLEVKRFPVYFGTREHGQSRWNINWQAKVGFIKRTVSYSFALRKRL